MTEIHTDHSDFLREVAQARARAEYSEYAAILREHRREWEAADRIESARLRQVERSMINLDIGQRIGLSEGQVMCRVSLAEQVSHRSPAVWSAFAEGRIDAYRVREIGSTIDRLQRPESVARLDDRVVAYAEAHTTSELKAWLRRFVARVEGDLVAERAEAGRAERRIDIDHGDDAMGWLIARLPSFVLAAIDRRLSKDADAIGAGDERTKPQRRADLFAAYLTTNEAGEVALNADIAVTIGADALAGATDGVAVSRDGLWCMPASWVAQLAQTGSPFWHRLVLDPVTGDVLSHEYLGRFAPDLLAKAIAFRDGVCRAPGCLIPADRCDLDHRRPWPEGPTSGANMWALCRRHHTAKGHDVLRWVLRGRLLSPDGIGRGDGSWN
jgi:hypothetical protein